MAEAVILAVIGLWSIWVVLGKLLPTLRRQLMRSLAQRCQQHGWQRLSAWLQPTAPSGCDSGCSSCATQCSSPTPLTTSRDTEEQAVKWHVPKS